MTLNLIPLRTRLEEHARKNGTRLDVIQQDYLLSWLLVAISQIPILRECCIFKGGTALKKCYFGDYRFSEDIDFTALDELPVGDNLEKEIAQSVELAQEMIFEFTSTRISYKRYREKYPHPDGQEAFSVYAQFPWQNQPLTKVMIEISRDEKMLFKGAEKGIIHPYGEPVKSSITSYTLEEIVYEKHRAILQHTKKLHERDWGRSRARDYYDLWMIFKKYGRSLDLNNFQKNLDKKCLGKEVSFGEVDDFFDPLIIKNVKETWTVWLGDLVSDLPDVEIVFSDLKRDIQRLLKYGEIERAK